MKKGIGSSIGGVKVAIFAGCVANGMGRPELSCWKAAESAGWCMPIN